MVPFDWLLTGYGRQCRARPRHRGTSRHRTPVGQQRVDLGQGLDHQCRALVIANGPDNGTDPTGESITVSCSVEDGKVQSCTALQTDDGVDKVFLRTKTTNSDGSVSTRTSVIGKESDLTFGRDLANSVESAFKQLYNVYLTMTVGTAAAAAGTVRGSPSSAGNIQRQVERGQVPREIDRVDKGRGPYEKDHIELKDGRALNRDGTWKHGIW